MLKPIEKPTRRTLVHHPSDALDGYCHYDVTDRNWLDFDESVSRLLIELEFDNRQYLRVRPEDTRRRAGF